MPSNGRHALGLTPNRMSLAGSARTELPCEQEVTLGNKTTNAEKLAALDAAHEAAEAPEAEKEGALTASARMRSTNIAKRGIGRLNANQELNQKRRAAIQYRTARALNWSRERILQETDWSLQWLMTVERYVQEEDREHWSETDPRTLFATYREQQMQVVRELEDLAEVFRGGRQHSALVASLKTRADIVDRIVKTGQELGVISKQPKQVEVQATVDITTLPVEDLKAHIRAQVEEIATLLEPARSLSPDPEQSSAASAVFRRLKRQLSPPIEAEAEVTETKPATGRKPRRKAVANDE